MLSRRSMTTLFEDSNEGALDSTGSSGNILDKENEIPSKKQTKRYQVFCELLETEQNYVDVLEIIINNFKRAFDELDDDDREAMISKHNLHMLFSKIEFILHIHRNILSSLQSEQKRWNDKNLIGQIYATTKDDLIKYYVPYMNSYDEILSILGQLLNNQDACIFLRRCEINSGKKFTIKDLLIRPIQRLPSVMLLLKELIKTTKRSNPDYEWLHKAISTIETVLDKSNESRRTTDEYQQTLDITSRIDAFPPELIKAARTFYCQADFEVLDSDGIFGKYKGSSLSFFLFNDILVVAKRRSRVHSVYYPNHSRVSSTSTLNTSMSDLNSSFNLSSSSLRRSLSVIFMPKKQRKPFRFLEALRFSSFRMFMYIASESLFFLKIRDERSEEMCSFKITSETTVQNATDLFETLCELINKTSNRDVSLVDISEEINKSDSESLMHVDDREHITKTRKKLVRKWSLKGTLRPLQSADSFKKPR